MMDDDLGHTKIYEQARSHVRPNGDARARGSLRRDASRPFREAIASLESFNGMVSHDLLGPLAGITHLADLALRALTDGRFERVAESLTLIRQQGRMSSQLLASLLLLSRAAKTGPRREPVALSPIVARAVEQVRLERPETARVQWIVRELAVMHVDPTLVQQVFVNLIGNAVKFSATVPSPRIEIGTEPAGTATAIFVRDNGIGFDKRSARIFKPSGRLHASVSVDGGIGLSIVRRIVELHGGRLWCNSRRQRGATVYFTLAAARPERS